MPPLLSPSALPLPGASPLPACITCAFFFGLSPQGGLLALLTSRPAIAAYTVLVGVMAVLLLRRGARKHRSTHVNTACARCGGPVTDKGYRRKIGTAYRIVCHHCAYRLES